MSIPDGAVNYIRFALQEIRQANVSVDGAKHYSPSGYKLGGTFDCNFLVNLSRTLDRAEGYIKQAIEEVQDETEEPADETTTAGNSGDKQ